MDDATFLSSDEEIKTRIKARYRKHCGKKKETVATSIFTFFEICSFLS